MKKISHEKTDHTKNIYSEKEKAPLNEKIEDNLDLYKLLNVEMNATKEEIVINKSLIDKEDLKLFKKCFQSFLFYRENLLKFSY